MNSFLINNIRIYNFKNRIDLIDYALLNSKSLIAINAKKITSLSENQILFVNNNIGYPDGIGAVFALKRIGVDSIKIPGCELWLDIIKRYPNKSYYLVGGTEYVISLTNKKLLEEFPGINIINYKCGYLSDNDIDSIISELKVYKPDFIFVACGSPFQENVIMNMNSHYKSVYVGLGGSFDVYSGIKSRAPKFIISYHLEWFYRILINPRRLVNHFFLIKYFFLFIKNRK